VVGLLAPAAAHAQSGLITKATNLPSIKLSSGQPLTEKPYEIEALSIALAAQVKPTQS